MIKHGYQEILIELKRTRKLKGKRNEQISSKLAYTNKKIKALLTRKKKPRNSNESYLSGDLPHTVNKLQEHWRALIIRVILVSMTVPLQEWKHGIVNKNQIVRMINFNFSPDSGPHWCVFKNLRFVSLKIHGFASIPAGVFALVATVDEHKYLVVNFCPQAIPGRVHDTLASSQCSNTSYASDYDDSVSV